MMVASFARTHEASRLHHRLMIDNRLTVPKKDQERPTERKLESLGESRELVALPKLIVVNRLESRIPILASI
jgi:hypothetical protein